MIQQPHAPQKKEFKMLIRKGNKNISFAVILKMLDNYVKLTKEK